MTGYSPPAGSQITTEAGLRASFPAPHDLAIRKQQSTLHKHACDFIARSPFLCIDTRTARGEAAVSPRDDPPGFVQVLDLHALVIPDRPVNNRLDTRSNILTNPQVGLLFVIPGFDNTLRVPGFVVLGTDPAPLDHLAVQDRTPTLAIVLIVQEVFLHCAKAFRRSRLWDPASLQNRKDMPRLLNIILDQTTGLPKDAAEMAKIDEGLEEAYRTSMY